MPVRALIARLPLSLRALVLVPLLAATIDQARVTFVCGPEIRSCLETAGGGRFGIFALLVLAAYTSAIALVVARVARRRGASLLLWAVATAGVWAVCGGQAALAGLFGGATTLGGGWLQLLAFGAAAGALLTVALAVLPAARALIHQLAPRLVVVAPFVSAASAPPAAVVVTRAARLSRGRAPPAVAA